jgi:hypothetical protein
MLTDGIAFQIVVSEGIAQDGFGIMGGFAAESNQTMVVRCSDHVWAS